MRKALPQIRRPRAFSSWQQRLAWQRRIPKPSMLDCAHAGSQERACMSDPRALLSDPLNAPLNRSLQLHCNSLRPFTTQQRPSRWEAEEASLNALMESIRNDPSITDDYMEQVKAQLEHYHAEPQKMEQIVQTLFNILKERGMVGQKDVEDRLLAFFHAAAQSWLDFAPPSAKRAQGVLDFMERNGLRPTLQTYNLVLESWASVPNAEQAHRLFQQQMEERDVESYEHVLLAWASSKSSLALTKAEEILKGMRRIRTSNIDSNKNGKDEKNRLIVASPLCYLNVLRCWERSGNAKDAPRRSLDLLRYIKKSFDGVDAERTHAEPTDLAIVQEAFSSTLRIHRKHDGVHRMEELLLEFQKWCKHRDRPIPLVEAMYVAVFSAWSDSKASRRALRAEKLLNAILAEGWEPQPSAVSYTAVLHCWANSTKAGSAKRAEQLLHRMSAEHHVQPNLLSFTCVMSAWGKSSDDQALSRVEDLFDEIQSKHGIQPDRFVFATLISAWGRSNHPEAADKADAYLQQSKTIHAEAIASDSKHAATYEPSVVEYTATIQAWSRCAKHHPKRSAYAVERVDALLQEMLNSGRHDCRPNTLTFAAILKTLSNATGIADKRERAEHILMTMERIGAKRSTYIDGIAGKCMGS